MSFELFPGLATWLSAFVVVSAVLSIIALVGLSASIVGNRRVRIARSESVRVYYGRLALGH